jgi:Autoinducer binding domain
MLTMIKIQEISKRDACSTLELINESLMCNDLDQFRQLIIKLQKIIAFEVATCLICKTGENGQFKSLEIVNINYPSEWIELYVANSYQQVDPIFKTNFRSFRLQYWADTYRKLPPPKKFLSMAEDFGLRRGYTHGAQNNTGDEGSLFFHFWPVLREMCTHWDNFDYYHSPSSSGFLPSCEFYSSKKRFGPLAEREGSAQMGEGGKKLLGDIENS